MQTNKARLQEIKEIKKIPLNTSGGPNLTNEEHLELVNIRKQQKSLTKLELMKQMQMQENARLERHLMELEHDKYVNEKAVAEQKSMQETVD